MEEEPGRIMIQVEVCNGKDLRSDKWFTGKGKWRGKRESLCGMFMWMYRTCVCVFLSFFFFVLELSSTDGDHYLSLHHAGRNMRE